jgi:hypothetical protein
MERRRNVMSVMYSRKGWRVALVVGTLATLAAFCVWTALSNPNAVASAPPAAMLFADPTGWDDSDGFDGETEGGSPGIGQYALVLNEFNAVGDGKQLTDGGSDPYIGDGTEDGNGGNWLELVVRGDDTGEDTVDLRNIVLEWRNTDSSGNLPNKGWVQFSNDNSWSAVQSGSIITIIQIEEGLWQGPASGTDPQGDDYRSYFVTNNSAFDTGTHVGEWYNVPVSADTYVEHGGNETSGGSFKVDNDNWRLRILQWNAGTSKYRIVQDWIGEDQTGFGNGGSGAVNSEEIAKSEVAVTSTDTPHDYDDGDNSTYGHINTVSGIPQAF